MTYLHFLNCVALTFAPSFLFYQGTKLAEYNAYLLCVYAALGYVATQAVKLLLLATFLPPLDDGVFQFVPELFKAIINCGDIVGIYLLLNLKRLGDGEIKILGIAVGWATAESLLRRLVPLWLGARQLEFNWEYIQMALQANINLVGIIAFTTLVWLWNRSAREGKGKSKKEEDKRTPYVIATALLYSFIPVLTSYLAVEVKLDGWYILLAHTGFAVVFALVSYKFYQFHTQRLAKKQS